MQSSCSPPSPSHALPECSEKEATGVAERAEESRRLPQTATPLPVRVRLQGGKVVGKAPLHSPPGAAPVREEQALCCAPKGSGRRSG